MRIKVKVKPNARTNELRETDKNCFEAKVTALPERGKANEKARELLSKYFKVPKSAVNLISGRSNREKVFEIDT